MNEVRLQKFFTDAGVMSRRAAEKEIESGNVKVNGRVAEIGMKIDPNKDIVTFNGKRISEKNCNYHYIIVNKPRGYICTMNDPQGRKCVTELVSDYPFRVYPVGRLDMISEGILLMTDDGDLANKMTHPSHSIPKIYRVKVAGEVSESQYNTLTSPMIIDGYKIRPVEVEITSADESGTVMKMTLKEGRNRQIRKMCEAVGLTVKRLNRVSIGTLKLNNLRSGTWRELNEDEVKYLKNNVK
ncbi:MAG: pseudouridine synthase [Eubacteriales bacterium]|nr:pseudouridine synthase [Eubacteriales bacterium]